MNWFNFSIKLTTFFVVLKIANNFTVDECSGFRLTECGYFNEKIKADLKLNV